MEAALRPAGRKNPYGGSIPVYEGIDLRKERGVGRSRLTAPEERHCGLGLLLIAPRFGLVPEKMHD